MLYFHYRHTPVLGGTGPAQILIFCCPLLASGTCTVPVLVGCCKILYRIPTQISDFAVHVSTPTSYQSSSPPGLHTAPGYCALCRLGGYDDWLLEGRDPSNAKSLHSVGILILYNIMQRYYRTGTGHERRTVILRAGNRSAAA